MWRLLTSFLLTAMTISAARSQAMASKQTVSSIFESLGFSPVCVANTLSSCESFEKTDSYFITELKAFLQLIRFNPNQSFIDFSANITASLAEITTLLLNKTDHQDLSIKKFNSSSTSENFIQNEIKEIRNELMSLKELKALMIEVKYISKEILSVNKTPKNCADVTRPDRVTKVYPFEENSFKPVLVLCDQTTDGGGWTVIQYRDALPVRENFTRGWNDYVKGFGDLNWEFWLGLEYIYALSNSSPMEFRVDLEDYDGVKKWAKYDSFSIGGSSTKYVLTLGNYSGDAGDSLKNAHNGKMFSTYDQDNDKTTGNCALDYRGGWWYNACHNSNLNGYQYVGQHASKGDGIHWHSFRGIQYSLKKISMKLRPKSRS